MTVQFDDLDWNEPEFTIRGGKVWLRAKLDHAGVRRLVEQLDGVHALLVPKSDLGPLPCAVEAPLSAAASTDFVETFINPPEPNLSLQAAAARYNESIRPIARLAAPTVGVELLPTWPPPDYVPEPFPDPTRVDPAAVARYEAVKLVEEKKSKENRAYIPKSTADAYRSAERTELIKLWYPVGVEIGVLTEELNKLPGVLMTVETVRSYASWLKVGRPVNFDRRDPAKSYEEGLQRYAPPTPLDQGEDRGDVVAIAEAYSEPARLTSTPSPPVQKLSRTEALLRSAAAASANLEPLAVDLDQLVSWAAVRGITVSGWNDLDKCNERCDAIGLRRFKRKQ
jgi:hypothetical protein